MRKSSTKKFLFDPKIERTTCKVKKEKLQAKLKNLEENLFENKKPYLMQITTTIKITTTSIAITIMKIMMVACHATTFQDV